MDRKRIADEVIEILCHKLHALPLPQDGDGFDYESQVFMPDITEEPLDIAEVSMDLEDAFAFNFGENLPGDQGLETIGDVINFIDEQVKSQA